MTLHYLLTAPLVSHSRRLRVLCLLGMPLAAPASAQTVVGSVRQQTDSMPLAGVLVTLERAGDGSTAARNLTDPAGAFALRASPGRYRLRAKRIGVRQYVSTDFQLATGETRRLHLLVDALIVPLDRVHVVGAPRCGRDAEGSAETARVLEESRAALSMATLTERVGPLVSVTRYVRHLAVAGELVVAESSSTARGRYYRPFASIPAQVLHEAGYIQLASDGALVFHAPDADVIASDAFLQDHCFWVAGDHNDSTRIALHFRPAPHRRLADVAGVMWLDRQSAELRSIALTYTRVPLELDSDRFNATLEFRRLPTGHRIVSQWAIKLPLFRTQETQALRIGPIAVPGTTRQEVIGLREEGGLVSVDGERAPGLGSVRGRVIPDSQVPNADSVLVTLVGTRRVTFADASGAFAFDSLLPGTYTVIASRETGRTTPGALGFENAVVPRDSEGQLQIRLVSGERLVRALCPDWNQRSGRGAMHILVVDSAASRTIPQQDFNLHASWYERVAAEGVRVRQESTPARTRSDGAYISCALRDMQTLSVRIGDGRSRNWPVGQMRTGIVIVRHIMR